MKLRSPGPVALSLPILLSLAACSPFEPRLKRVASSVDHVGSVQCDASDDAPAALADSAAGAERRFRGGHRFDEAAILFPGTRVTTTVTCLESIR